MWSWLFSSCLEVPTNPLVSPFLALAWLRRWNQPSLARRNHALSHYKRLGLISIQARSAPALVSSDRGNAVERVADMRRFDALLCFYGWEKYRFTRFTGFWGAMQASDSNTYKTQEDIVSFSPHDIRRYQSIQWISNIQLISLLMAKKQ